MEPEEEKGPGRGRGGQTEAGVQKLEAAKVANIESFLASKFPGEFSPVEDAGEDTTE
jgi:hypothetical protein